MYSAVKELSTINKIDASKITIADIDASGISYSKEYGVFYPTGQNHLVEHMYLEKRLTELRYKTFTDDVKEWFY